MNAIFTLYLKSTNINDSWITTSSFKDTSGHKVKRVVLIELIPEKTMSQKNCSYYYDLTNGVEAHLTADDISFYIYYYTFIFLIVLVNIFGNTMIIVAFIKHKKLR